MPSDDKIYKLAEAIISVAGDEDKPDTFLDALLYAVICTICGVYKDETERDTITVAFMYRLVKGVNK